MLPVVVVGIDVIIVVIVVAPIFIHATGLFRPRFAACAGDDVLYRLARVVLDELDVCVSTVLALVLFQDNQALNFFVDQSIKPCFERAG